MLAQLEIENYRSLKHVELTMRPLTVLIGPNGSGKSNLLDAFSLLAAAARGSLADSIVRRGGFDVAVFRGTEDCHKRVFFRLEYAAEPPFVDENTPVTYEIQLRSLGTTPIVWFEQVSKAPDPRHDAPLYIVHRDQEGCAFRNIQSGEREEPKGLEAQSELAISQVVDQTSYPTPYKLVRHLQDWTFYRPFDVSENGAARLPQVTRSGTRLFPNGENLASVLYSIQQQYPHVWDDILDVLKNAYSDLKFITFPPEGGDGKIILRWWENPYHNTYGFPASQLSDGTLRLLCLLAILKSPDPPPLVCIDEPEVGLHPDWIKLVGELLEEASIRTQLIVATHSAELVSHVKPSSVVVCEKENGETTLERLDEQELAVWLEKFHLGDLWLSGQIGGRP